MPVQKQILDWSGKLQAWNGERLQHADHALVTQFANLQGGLSRVLAIGFGSGLLLVLGSMAYIVRLDRQTRGRYVRTCAKPACAAATLVAPGGRTGDRTARHLSRAA